jgi:pimeloyl-ACP methyl ester carboxylesterase
MRATISRRVLLRMAGGAAPLSLSALTVDAAQSGATAPSGRVMPEPRRVGPAALDDDVFYRDDWLGEPWRTAEVALLIHGAYESSEAWFGWVPRLAQEFRLLRPDLPGFGSSKIPAGFDWSLASLTGMLARFLDRVGVESVHVIGAKLGGSIAMQFAADYPRRTRTLVVVSSPASRPTMSSTSSVPQRDRLGSGASQAQVEYWNALMAAANREAVQGMGRMLSALNLEPVLSRITAPTLVITSDRSPLQSVEAVMRYQRKIPNSRLLVLSSDAYHVAVAKADECVTNTLTFIHETRDARP